MLFGLIIVEVIKSLDLIYIIGAVKFVLFNIWPSSTYFYHVSLLGDKVEKRL